MSAGIKYYTVYLLPGMTIEIKAIDAFTRHGTVAKHRTQTGEIVSRDLVHGFCLDDEEVGTLTEVADKPAVEYEHKKYMPNTITFYGRFQNQISKVIISSVQIHDHASIVTGGPAFATYYTDDD